VGEAGAGEMKIDETSLAESEAGPREQDVRSEENQEANENISFFLAESEREKEETEAREAAVMM
jgi:hypothetical protein